MKGLEFLCEARIQAAKASGDLDGLPGRGRPANVDDLAGLTREERIQALLQRSVGGVPEEVRLLRELGELEAAHAAAASDLERSEIRAKMQERAVRLSILFEASGRHVLANKALDFMP